MGTRIPTRRRRGFNMVEVVLGTFLMTIGVLIFAALYPSASHCARMSGAYSQAISAVQHKVDQLRSVGYGRLTYADLTAAGIIDTSAGTQPFRFEGVDQISQVLPSPQGTILVESAGTDLSRVTVRLQWAAAPHRSTGGWHEVTALIPNE